MNAKTVVFVGLLLGVWGIGGGYSQAAAGTTCPDPEALEVSYVSPDPAVCARLRFTCAEGETPFSSACGCGCMRADLGAQCGMMPTGACTTDINPCGNPSACQCPAAYTYHPVVGLCLSDDARVGTATFQAPADHVAASDPFEEQAAAQACVLEPEGICTEDLNACGHASICQCPNGYAYDPVVGKCVKMFEPCGGIQGLACADGQICDLPAGLCGAADLQGTCIARPEACTEEFQPVCDCEGKTHPNECYRLRAGAQKAHDGACPVQAR